MQLAVSAKVKVMKTKLKLKNNINLICDDNPALNTVVLSVFFRCGTLYESKDSIGISHFIEHMFFRRLNKLSHEELYIKMNSIGGELRGKTYNDYVCFDIKIVPKFFNEALEIITDILADFEWNAKEISQEKKIVLNQIKYKNESFDEFTERVYLGKSKYALPIMGYAETIERFTAKEVNKAKKQFFNCDNSCVVITGGFSGDDILNAVSKLEKIKNNFGKISPKVLFPNNFSNRSEKSDKIFPSDDDISDVWIAFDVTVSNIDEFYAAQIIYSILCEGVLGKIPYALIDKYSLTDFVQPSIYLYRGFARIMFRYYLPNSNIKESLRIVIDEIIKLKKQVTQTDLDTSKVFYSDNLLMRKDIAYDLAFYYGRLDYVLEYDYDIDDIIKSSNSITLDALEKTAKKILTPNNMTINVMNNSKIQKKAELKQFIFELRQLIRD